MFECVYRFIRLHFVSYDSNVCYDFYIGLIVYIQLRILKFLIYVSVFFSMSLSTVFYHWIKYLKPKLV